jgi:hypothetical protein
MQTRCEKYNFLRENRQLSLLALLHLVLWCCATWVSNHTYYVTPSQMFMLLLERYTSFGDSLTLALGEMQSALHLACISRNSLRKSKTMDGYGENMYHDLHLDTLTANIIEHEFGTRGSLIVYPPGSLNLYILAGFSGLEATVRSNKVSEIGVDVEFMRVRGGILRFAKLVDVP